MVLFDTSVLILAFDEHAKPPEDPVTNAPLIRYQDRVLHLIKTLDETRERILVPTPVLAEYLVRGGPDKSKRLDTITKSQSFRVEPFDLKAAIECASIEDSDLARGRTPSADMAKAKVKFDRQIIAIAKAANASCIYTGDGTLAAVAKANGLRVVMTWELPLPPEKMQEELPFPENPDRGSW